MTSEWTGVRLSDSIFIFLCRSHSGLPMQLSAKVQLRLRSWINSPSVSSALNCVRTRPHTTTTTTIYGHVMQKGVPRPIINLTALRAHAEKRRGEESRGKEGKEMKGGKKTKEKNSSSSSNLLPLTHFFPFPFPHPFLYLIAYLKQISLCVREREREYWYTAFYVLWEHYPLAGPQSGPLIPALMYLCQNRTGSTVWHCTYHLGGVLFSLRV